MLFRRRWGVVQSVGHLTVNEDGVGSSPTAPANLFFRRAIQEIFPGFNLGLMDAAKLRCVNFSIFRQTAKSGGLAIFKYRRAMSGMQFSAYAHTSAVGCGLFGCGFGVGGGSRSEGRTRRPSPQSPKGILGASSLLRS